MSETTSEPHVLVVESCEPQGPGYDGKETYEYECDVRHPATCPTETCEDDGDPLLGPFTVYTCMVQHMIDGAGYDDITEFRRLRIEPGEYKIEGWSAYYPSTPVSGEEWDGGLRFIEDPA